MAAGRIAGTPSTHIPGAHGADHSRNIPVRWQTMFRRAQRHGRAPRGSAHSLHTPALFDLPPMECAHDTAVAAQAVLAAVSKGDLTPIEPTENSPAWRMVMV